VVLHVKLVVELLYDVAAIHRGAVFDDDNFEVVVVLSGKAGEQVGDLVGTVINRNDDRDKTCRHRGRRAKKSIKL